MIGKSRENMLIYEQYINDHQYEYLLLMSQGEITHGVRRFGDAEDDPAEDPMNYIKPPPVWFVPKDMAKEILSNGNKNNVTVILFYDTEYFYHIRKAGLSLILKIPKGWVSDEQRNYIDDEYYDIARDQDGTDYIPRPREYDINPTTIKNNRYVEIPFESLEKCEKLWVEFYNYHKSKSKNDVRDGESSEDYWNRKISNVMMYDKHRKRDYDGD
jgi:hypothetical protein